MKKVAFLMVALLLPSGAPRVVAAPAPEGLRMPDNRIVAVGGTQLSNGIFFPGTAECTREGCRVLVEGTELEIERGENVTFTNLDPYEHANAHSIVSFRTNKRGRPLFASRDVKGPEEINVRTRHLKRGSYAFYCRTHFGMYGILKVVRPSSQSL